MKELRFITQFKIEIVLLFTGFRKVFGKTLAGRNKQVYDGNNGDRKSIFKSKKYILWTFNELVQIIKEEDDEGLSQLKFSMIYSNVRSKKEYIIQSNIPDVDCLCPVCENTELLCEAISNCKRNETLKVPTKCHEIFTKIGCGQLIEDCCNNTCKECPLLDLEVDQEVLNDIEEICYYEWINEKYYSKELIRSGSDLKARLTEKFLSLKRHYYNKREQSKKYKEHISNLKGGEFVIHVDYSENYKNKQQR